MLIHLHSQAIVRHGFEDSGEGNDDAKDPGGDRGQ